MLTIVSTKVELSRNSVSLLPSQVVLEGLKYKLINIHVHVHVSPEAAHFIQEK